MGSADDPLELGAARVRELLGIENLTLERTDDGRVFAQIGDVRLWLTAEGNFRFEEPTEDGIRVMELDVDGNDVWSGVLRPGNPDAN